MEHFSDQEIFWLLREQIRVGKRVVFSVPSDHYPVREWGDERQLSPINGCRSSPPAPDRWGQESKPATRGLISSELRMY
jgi:hypothetical protein